MIKKDSFIAMATALKMDVAAATAAWDAKDEQEVKAPDGLNIFTADELTTRETTVKTVATQAGMEIAIKVMKEKAGLTYEGQGSKDPERFITELTNKAVADARIPTDKKVGELTATVEGLRLKLTEHQQMLQEKDKAVTAYKNDTTLLMHTVAMKPDNLNNQEWIALLKAGGIGLEDKDGATIVTRGGKAVEDNLLKPVPPEKALPEFVKEKGWGKAAGAPPPVGRGANDSTTGQTSADKAAIANMSQFTKYCEDNKIDAKSSQAANLLTEVTTANKDFDFAG